MEVKSELYRPNWRNLQKFAEILRREKVQSLVCNYFSKNHNNSELKFNCKSPAEEYQVISKSFLRDIRLTDLGDQWYWVVMLFLTCLFILVEAFLVGIPFIENKPEAPFLGTTIIALICLLCFLLVTLIFYAAFILRAVECAGEPPLPLNFPPALLHAVPVVVCAAGLLLINYYLVKSSGGANSPFLPTFLATALIIVSLPRDDTKLSWILLACALGLGADSIFHEEYLDKNLKLFLSENLSIQTINYSTFAYSALATAILRKIGAKSIPK